ncbi:MAG: 16S rRNA (cytidine(1402)-2'-O)-methyltransferase [Planctomycetota bacterium]|nr:16S rRNA (cytidine(1402)-2'-O)-methyltransferase [Planctomycetota bacterium]
MSPPEKELPPILPGVHLVGTPIGNLEDITLRALRVLGAAGVLAAEDTRVTRKLFQRYNLKAPKTIYACNAHNEEKIARKLADLAAAGETVVFASDAGMPGISDPGRRIVRAALESGVNVEVIPGPSAVTTALAICGLNAASFTFLGFPSRRDGRLSTELIRHGQLAPAMVFYESPRRLVRLLAMAREILGAERDAAICIELTKKFERVFRGKLEELAKQFAGTEVRGEIVVVISGQV